MVELSTLVFGAVFAGIGSILAYVGYERLRLRRALASHDRRRPDEVQPGDSVLVEGTARAVDGTHTAPIDGDSAVLTRYKVESRDISAGEAEGWQTLKQETLVEPFHLGDGDRVAVASESPDLATTDASSRSREVTPEELDRERNVPITLEQLSTDNLGEKMRHRQASIKEGQEVLVLGSARRDGDGVVIGRGDHTPFFYVMDDVDAVSGAAVYVAVGLLGAAMLLVGVGVVGTAVL